MRVDVAGTGHWIEFRGPDELTIGDIDAFNVPFEEIFAAQATAGMEASDDGASLRPAGAEITADHLRRRRDALLARVITGWSFTPPMPYAAEKREGLPAAAVPALVKVYDILTTAIGELDGPKETTADSGGSASTSPDESGSAPPDSAPAPSETAGGSSPTS